MDRQNERILKPEQALPRIAALLDAGLPCRLVVTGSSMLPFLRHKQDAVFLVPVEDSIRAGDILFYLRGNGAPILHRVHRLDPDGLLILCGDAQTGLEPVRREQVLAKVSQVERNGKLTPCGAWHLKAAVTLWRWAHPVRPYLLAILRKVRYIQ